MEDRPTECSHKPAPDSAETANHAKPGVSIPLRLRRESDGVAIEVRQTSALVGRGTQADVHLEAPDISRRHCRILLEDGLWRIHDLGSTNGIFVNGHRLPEAVLHPGDRLWIGSVAFLVEQAVGQRTIAGRQGQALASIVRSISKSA